MHPQGWTMQFSCTLRDGQGGNATLMHFHGWTRRQSNRSCTLRDGQEAMQCSCTLRDGQGGNATLMHFHGWTRGQSNRLCTLRDGQEGNAIAHAPSGMDTEAMESLKRGVRAWCGSHEYEELKCKCPLQSFSWLSHPPSPGAYLVLLSLHR